MNAIVAAAVTVDSEVWGISRRGVKGVAVTTSATRCLSPLRRRLAPWSWRKVSPPLPLALKRRREVRKASCQSRRQASYDPSSTPSDDRWEVEVESVLGSDNHIPHLIGIDRSGYSVGGPCMNARVVRIGPPARRGATGRWLTRLGGCVGRGRPTPDGRQRGSRDRRLRALQSRGHPLETPEVRGLAGLDDNTPVSVCRVQGHGVDATVGTEGNHEPGQPGIVQRIGDAADHSLDRRGVPGPGLRAVASRTRAHEPSCRTTNGRP